MTAYLLPDISRAATLIGLRDDHPATDDANVTVDAAQPVDLETARTPEPDWPRQWRVLKFL